MLVFDVELGAGESKEFRYFNAIAADKTLALDLFEKGQRTFDDLLQHSEQIFNDLISCAFAPGNSELVARPTPPKFTPTAAGQLRPV